jgi:sulfonate transport system substrate-binding protein
MKMSRRFFIGLGLIFGLAAIVTADPAKELRIGYQKAASHLLLLRAHGTLEKQLAPRGIVVKWVEFPAGPQLLEALNVSSIDFGYVGEAPPIFAQAAGADFVYVGYEDPSPQAEAILVPKNSALRSIADLKGKKIALNKGSNVHYLLVKALEKAGLRYSDIQPVYLAPADARAAFQQGSVDAWAIWDPFYSAAQTQLDARVLTDATNIVANYLYFLAARSYAVQQPEVIKLIFDESLALGQWIKGHYHEAAVQIAPLEGLDVAIVEQSLRHYALTAHPINNAILRDQQKVADTFSDLKLIPKPLVVQEATVVAPNQQ